MQPFKQERINRKLGQTIAQVKIKCGFMQLYCAALIDYCIFNFNFYKSLRLCSPGMLVAELLVERATVLIGVVIVTDLTTESTDDTAEVSLITGFPNDLLPCEKTC